MTLTNCYILVRLALAKVVVVLGVRRGGGGCLAHRPGASLDGGVVRRVR
jgi:hypothetical protein